MNIEGMNSIADNIIKYILKEFKKEYVTEQIKQINGIISNSINIPDPVSCINKGRA